MSGERIRSSMADIDRRLARLRSSIECGAEQRTPALDQALEDLCTSLEELNVALEELESTNEELATAKLTAESEGRRYQNLFQLTPGACLVTDRSGVIQELNQAGERLLGRHARYLAGKPLSTFVLPTDHSHFFGFLDRVCSSGGEVVGEEEVRIQRSMTDLPLTVGLTALPIVDLQGREVGACWLIRDLSAQLRAERSRMEASERTAYRYIAGGVIHHVNNLLGSIRGYSEILAASRDVAPGDQRAVRQIHAATQRGERFTTQLLAFARAGRPAAQAQPIHFLIDEACESAAAALTNGTRIVKDLSSEASSISVRIDPKDFSQAFLGLILNAQDAQDSGEAIEVFSRIVHSDEVKARRLDLEPGGYVAISVRDQGRGMDSQTHARALEPFFSTKAIGSGFGLGLSTVEAVVREARGAIDLESSAGLGSVATIYLPISRPLSTRG